MADPMLNMSSTIVCSHGGSVTIITSNVRVKVGGDYAVTASDTFTVSGCPFQVPIGTGSKPQPCTMLNWVKPAARVKINGQPVLTLSSSGLCKSSEQIPQGPPSVASTQLKGRAL